MARNSRNSMLASFYMSHELSFHNWLNYKLFRREKNGNKKSQIVSNSTSYENSNNKPTPNLKC